MSERTAKEALARLRVDVGPEVEDPTRDPVFWDDLELLLAHVEELEGRDLVAHLRRQRSEIEDCGQDGVCKLSPGCNRHWEERNRELLRENEVLRSNSDHLSSENASLARQVESMAMRIESLAEELAKPEDVRLREVLDALDGRAVIFDGLGVRVTHLLDEMDEWIARAGAAERRLKKAEEVVMLARQLTAYSWEDRLEDCEVSDAAKHDSRELSTAIWFYDQEEKS